MHRSSIATPLDSGGHGDALRQQDSETLKRDTDKAKDRDRGTGGHSVVAAGQSRGQYPTMLPRFSKHHISTQGSPSSSSSATLPPHDTLWEPCGSSSSSKQRAPRCCVGLAKVPQVALTSTVPRIRPNYRHLLAKCSSAPGWETGGGGGERSGELLELR
ncbi:unnamed protein product [Lampetra planeri]